LSDVTQVLRRILLHNVALMPSRLTIALAISLALHGSLFLPDAFQRISAAPPRPALQAVLRLPPKPEAAPAEPLLKNTLDSEDAPRISQAAPLASPQPTQQTVAKRQVQAAQKKLSQHLYYPPEAIARGIEGEVRLIITLTEDGSIADVNLAASSGHPILDNAAIKAAYATGKLSGATSRELILPVIFRLQ
jgi:protein TonB